MTTSDPVQRHFVAVSGQPDASASIFRGRSPQRAGLDTMVD